MRRGRCSLATPRDAPELFSSVTLLLCDHALPHTHSPFFLCIAKITSILQLNMLLFIILIIYFFIFINILNI